MWIDSRNEFADAVNAYGAAGTANIGNQIPVGAAAQSLGENGKVFLVIQVTTAFAGGTGTTTKFQLVSDDSASISTTTQTIHAATAAYTNAQLAAGTEIVLAIPPSLAYETYLGVQAVGAVDTSTAGAINAFLTVDAGTWKAYSSPSQA